MEIAQAYAWLYSTMQADTQLTTASVGGVWQGFAPIGTIGPYSLIVHQASTDVLTANAVRLFDHLVIQVKGVGPASNYAGLVTIANRIDALFGRVGQVALSQGGVLACWREQGISYDELVNGVQWSHLGGLYHIELQGS